MAFPYSAPSTLDTLEIDGQGPAWWVKTSSGMVPLDIETV